METHLNPNCFSSSLFFCFDRHCEFSRGLPLYTCSQTPVPGSPFPVPGISDIPKNMYGINNKRNGVVRIYVTTSVTHKPKVRIDLLTFMQMVNNFALEPYSKLCSFHNLSVNRNVCQITMRFEEANCACNN